jgi:hypothetical protein
MNEPTQHFTRRRKPLLVAAGLVMVVLLGIGGALAGSALAGSAQPGGSPGTPGTAATLNTALSSTSSATSAAPAAKARRAAALVRLRRLGGMYGQAAFRGKDGTTRTYAFERGTVTSDSSALVVKAANGTTWTWQYESATAVRQGGRKVSRSDLSSGEHVLVAGPVTAGNRVARVIIIARATSTTPSPAPSSSASSSSGSTSSS